MSLTYDEDGNLTNMPASSGITATGGSMRLTWNAENRLIAVAPQSPTDGDTRVEFIYDYMGRRVQKTAFTYAGDTWSQSSEVRFVYDGWNLVEEITIAGNISGDAETNRYYVWGLDLSLSLQGAGGVGGLLAAIAIDDATPETFLYCYDANGNVGQMIAAATGEIAARYEYDPFGNLTRSTGEMAEDNPFRFSTKYHDNETGLYYYGYRYYETEMGRWLNRDPMGDDAFFGILIIKIHRSMVEGFLNSRHDTPYLMINNDPLQNYDYIGLVCSSKNRCDKWRLTIVTAATISTGPGTAFVQVSAQLSADRSCCMDNYTSRYVYEGAGIGAGIKFSFAFSGEGKWMDTPCITWEDHEGLGRITTTGIGLWWTVGTLWADTPQGYLNFSGKGKGFDLSGVTSIGRWYLGSDISGK